MSTQADLDRYLELVIRDFALKCKIESKYKSGADILQDSRPDVEMSDCGVDELKRVLSIDIGIKNLGLAVSTLNEDFSISSIDDIVLLDITNIRHKRVPLHLCKLHHSNCVSDWLSHVFQEYSWFDDVDYIIVERQPIQGITSVEQVIMHQYRDKTILISPTTMHHYFNISQYEYEQRKKYTTDIALYTFTELETRSDIVEKFKSYVRCHDIADAICFTVFWSSTEQSKFKLNKHKNNIHNIIKKGVENCSLDEWFEQFRYQPQRFIKCDI